MKQFLQKFKTKKTFIILGILFFSSATLKAQCDSTFTYTTDTSGYLVNFTPQDAFALSYSWDFGDGNSSIDASPSYNYADTGAYTVCLTVTTFVQGQQVQCSSCQNVIISTNNTIDSTANLVNLNEIKYSVFPNPFNDYLTIDIENNKKDLSFELVNVNGVVLIKDVLKPTNNTINTLKLEKGIYFVKIITPEGNYSTQTLIKH